MAIQPSDDPDHTTDPGTKSPSAKDIFIDACDLPPDLRQEYLRKHCGSNHELRKAVDRLLHAHDNADGFMAQPTREPPVDEPLLSQKIGRYKLLQKIGEGGFGSVYMAEQEEPVRRRVALKIIKLGMDTKAVIARFEAERQALAIMDHPNIAKVFDAGATETGRPYFVMELVNGIPITEYCDANKLTTRQRLELFLKVCQAVQHAHSKGIIHRDIKPNNVLTTMHDDVAVPKVIDFGVAKAMHQRLTERTLFTEFRQMIGTPQYMSPEQAQMSGLDIDTRSDVYSLGVLLYELLTGTTPLDAKALRTAAYDQMQKMIQEQEAPAPSTRLSTMGEQLSTVAAERRTDPGKLRQSLRGEIDWIVLRSLEKDRTRRYETASGMARDIERYLADEAVEACPPSTTYRARKFIRKHRRPVLAAALILVAILIGAVVSVWQAARATRAEKQAIAQRDEIERSRQLAEDNRRLAVVSEQKAVEESNNARRAAFRSEARYLTQQGLLPAALARATEAYNLNGQWEDGFTFQEIAAAARRDWRLFRRVPMEDKPDLCCVGMAYGTSEDITYTRIVVAHGSRLQLFGRQVGSATRESPPTGVLRTSVAPIQQASPSIDIDQKIDGLYWSAPTDSVLVLGDRSVGRYKAPDLERAAFRSFDSPIIDSDISESALALTFQDGIVRVLKLSDLSDLDSLHWNENPVTKQFPVPGNLLISPSGLRLRVGDFLWIRSSSGAGQILKSPGMEPEDFAAGSRFVDDKRLILIKTWEHDNNGVFPFNIFLARFPRNFGTDEMATWQRHRIFTEDAKGKVRDFAAWVEPSGETSYGIATDSGCTLATFTAAGLSTSTRFANLMPFNKDVPKFLCADLRDGLLLMKSPHELLLFLREIEGEDDRQQTGIDNFCASACDRGLLCADDRYPQSPISLRPYDPAEPQKFFSIQHLHDPAHGAWYPWALGENASASTMVVINQLARNDNNPDGFLKGFTRVQAVVWRGEDLDQPSRVWPVQCVIDTPLFPTTDSNLYLLNKKNPNRFIAVDPTGNFFAYKDAAGTLTRFSIPNRRLLESVELGKIANRSPDGRFVAGVTAAGLLRAYDITTGSVVFQLDHCIGVNGLCFSADSRLLLVHSLETIDSYQLSTGDHVGAIPSHLIPLAWPAMGGNRFVGLQTDSSASGGDVFLADTTDGKPITVLLRAAMPNAPAFFSPSGKDIAIVRSDSDASILRSLSPDQVAVEVGDSNETIQVASTMPSYHEVQEPASATDSK